MPYGAMSECSRDNSRHICQLFREPKSEVAITLANALRGWHTVVRKRPSLMAKQRQAFSKVIADSDWFAKSWQIMATLIYVGEELSYRTVGMMDLALNEVDKAGADCRQRNAQGDRGVAVECSILKSGLGDDRLVVD